MSLEPGRRAAELFPDLPTLGARRRWARQRAALTQADLARLLEKGQPSISSVEHDRIESPARVVMAALAARLAVSPAWRMDGTATAFTAEELRRLQDCRHLVSRDRALVRFWAQERRRLAPVPEPQTAPLSESARRLARHWEPLAPEGQAAIQAALQSLLPPSER